MIASPLPAFSYHPDPIATGVVESLPWPCACCGRERGYLYTGPLYGPPGTNALKDKLCPWCIADGSAAERFNATFVDVGWGVPDAVPNAVLEELSQRTPCFQGWQQEHWLYHCDDAAAYLGTADHERLRRHPTALEAVLHENDEFGWSAEESRAWAESMSVDGSPTAYLFRCCHCGIHLAYGDMD